MKKVYWLALVLGFALSCTEETPLTNKADELVAAPTQRACASYEVLQEQIRQDPARGRRLEEIEAFINKVQENPKLGRLVNGVYEIPVWVNVLYKTAAENVSAEQIQSQIDVLTEDFGGTNADRTLVPPNFTGVFAGNTNIKFVLEGVTRKATTKTSWRTNDDMKRSSRGGIDPTSPTTNLNMWVCTLGNSILGYAQFPGGSSATDGVVILNTAFGRTGTATAPFNLGRTATHEVGHWLDLRHIWGDATCGTDGVSDTPTHNTANYGCPASGHKSTCTGTPIEMWMNFMDYTDDRCMYMFSAGQESRMLATFASGGPRNSFAQP
ncbi:MAG: zinc metalloprotease [Bacteroidota bacterium]